MISWKEVKRAVAQVVNAYQDLGMTESLPFAVDVLRFLYANVPPQRFIVELTGVSTAIARRYLAYGRRLAATQIEAWYKGSGAVSPTDFAVLYAIGRTLRPRCIVETGTRAGVSTTALAYAVRDNGVGVVHTVDWGKQLNAEGKAYLYSDIGCLIPPDLLGFVRFHTADVCVALPSLLRAHRPGLVFLDDLHTPERHRWEMEQARAHLVGGAVVLCDDVTRGWVAAAGTWRNSSFLGGIQL